VFWNKSSYSLERGGGIENVLLCKAPSPAEEYEKKLTREQLYKAIECLPDMQRRRIYAYYFIGMSKAAIARAESVTEGVVRKAIDKGLRAIKNSFDENC